MYRRQNVLSNVIAALTTALQRDRPPPPPSAHRHLFSQHALVARQPPGAADSARSPAHSATEQRKHKEMLRFDFISRLTFATQSSPREPARRYPQ